MYNRVYIHVPFCVAKCHYCAFVSAVAREQELEEYGDLVIRELQLHPCSSRELDSLYFGGGTPVLLSPQQIGRIIDALAAQNRIADGAEVTIEANPGCVDSDSLRALKSVGVTRISLGVQSFDDFFLNRLGRVHNSDQVLQAYRDIRRVGFSNVSIDLIHSLPGQNIKQWQAELRQAICLEPEHISIYGLTVEEGTPLAHMYPEGSQHLADHDLSADMFELADAELTAAGYEHYETANYARPGYRSRHNCGYWHRDGYLGLGVAAHSFMRQGYGIRYGNAETLAEYRQEVVQGRLQRSDELRLTLEMAMAEFMFLGLRLREGVHVAAFTREFGRSLDSVYGSEVAELIGLGLLSRSCDAVMVTPKGMALSNQVFRRFV